MWARGAGNVTVMLLEIIQQL